MALPFFQGSGRKLTIYILYYILVILIPEWSNFKKFSRFWILKHWNATRIFIVTVSFTTEEERSKAATPAALDGFANGL